MVQGLRFGVWGLGFEAQGFGASVLGFEVQGFRVEKLWFGIWGSSRLCSGLDFGF